MSTSYKEQTREGTGVSRRDFLAGAGIAGVAAAASTSGLMGSGVGIANADETTEESTESTAAVTEELDFPGEEEASETTSYECDVLVVGSGWAGLHAAIRAARAGASVICMDKGKPGYSGLTPWSGCTTWYDEDYDNLEGSIAAIQKAGEYTANLDYLRQYILDTTEAWELNKELGVMVRYNGGKDDGYDSYTFTDDDIYEYYENYRDIDRHAIWESLFTDNGVEVLSHTMLVDVVTDATDEQRVTGAVAFQFRSSTVISVSCKAVVLATGPGVVKSGAYPGGGNSFDGEYICYQLGLPIIGKEYDDFHQGSSWAPGDGCWTNIWDYMQCLDVGTTFKQEGDEETIAAYAKGKASFMTLNRLSQALYGLSPVDGTARRGGGSGTIPDSDDPRDTDWVTADIGDRGTDLYGAAAGMSAHMLCGVFCGWDDYDGYTGIPGLYVAGDGTYGTMMEGALYGAIYSTSSGCSVMGDRSGVAAAAYAATVENVEVPQEKIDEITEEIFAPTLLEKGFDPNWARCQLHNVMAAPQVHIVRNEATLNAALCEVEWLRDQVVPLMMGYTGHDLRMCLEVKHAVLACELKLRVQIAHKESRGMHYRIDYPYRDDENYLCHLTIRKGDDGEPLIEKVEIPDEWKGDVDADYTSRYVWRFPGEEDALGLTDEE